MAKSLEPFISVLTHGNTTAPGCVTLANFDGEERITSPRSLAAVRCEGLSMADLMPIAPEKLLGSARFQTSQRKQWDQQRARYLQECRARFEQLEDEAARHLRDKEANNLEEALAQRERVQHAREDRMREVKANMITRMINEQLRLQGAKDEAAEKVAHKQKLVEAKHSNKVRRLREASQKKLTASLEKKAAVDSAAKAALEETVRKRVLREEAARQSQERLHESRVATVEHRKERAKQKQEDLCDKKRRCASESRARVATLLEKREKTELKQAELQELRAEELQQKAETIALRTLTIQSHVVRRKAQEEVQKERAKALIQEKCKRADRLAGMREKIKHSHEAIDVTDRQKRKALAQWKAEAEATGDFTVPEWLRDISEGIENAQSPKINASSCVQPPDREHYSSWMFNNEIY